MTTSTIVKGTNRLSEDALKEDLHHYRRVWENGLNDAIFLLDSKTNLVEEMTEAGLLLWYGSEWVG